MLGPVCFAIYECCFITVTSVEICVWTFFWTSRRNEKSHPVSIQICINADLKRIWNEKGALTSSVWIVASNNSHHCTTNRRACHDRYRGRSNFELKKKLNYASWCTYAPENIAARRGESVTSLELIVKSQNSTDYANSTKLRLKQIKNYIENLYKTMDGANQHLPFLFEQIFVKNSFFLFR